MYRVDEEAKTRTQPSSFMERIYSVFCGRKRKPTYEDDAGNDGPSSSGERGFAEVDVPHNTTTAMSMPEGLSCTVPGACPEFEDHWPPAPEPSSSSGPQPPEATSNLSSSDSDGDATTSAPSSPGPITPPPHFSTHLMSSPSSSMKPQVFYGPDSPVEGLRADFGPSSISTFSPSDSLFTPINSPESAFQASLPLPPAEPPAPRPTVSLKKLLPPIRAVVPREGASTLELFQLCTSKLQTELDRMAHISAYLDEDAKVREMIVAQQEQTQRIRAVVAEQKKELRELRDRVAELENVTGTKILPESAALDAFLEDTDLELDDSSVIEVSH